MPSIDFEHESRVGETIARPRRGRPNRLLGFLLTGCAVVALSYAAYVSTRGARVTPKNDNEAFNTARAGVLLGFDNAEAKADNRLQLPPVPAPPAAPSIVASAVTAPPMIVDDGEAQRKAEEEKRRLEAEAHENARLRSGMLVIDVPSASAAGFGAGSANAGPIKVQGPEEDSNRRFLANAADVETSHANKIARIDALVPQGTMIRGTLETAIEFGPSGDGQGDHPRGRLFLRWPPRLDPQRNDADGGISVRVVARPDSRICHLDPIAAFRRHIVDAWVLRDRQPRPLGSAWRCRRALFRAIRFGDSAEHRRRRKLLRRRTEFLGTVGHGRRGDRLLRRLASPDAGPANGLADLLGSRQSGPQGLDQHPPDHPRRPGKPHHRLRQARSRFFAMVSRSREGSAL